MNARTWVGAFLLVVLSGCIPPPMIDTAGMAPPKRVVLIDIPKMSNAAMIGVITPWAPGFPQFHFSERADRFFEVAGQPAASSGVAGFSQGLIGYLIESKAAETQKKSSAEFNIEILKRFPDFDLRGEFMTSLRAALEARGIAVVVAADRRAQVPRLLWPASDKDGNKYPSGSLEGSPPVDADLLLQVSPVAFYNSPGPLNAYTRSVSVGVALYDGRTRRFIGRQNVFFSTPDARFQYYQYDSLVADLAQAAPALRNALMSLVPAVADIVSARK